MALWLRDIWLPLVAAVSLHLLALYCAALGWSGQSLWREQRPSGPASAPLSARLLPALSRTASDVGATASSTADAAPESPLAAPSVAAPPWFLPSFPRLPALSDEPMAPLPAEPLLEGAAAALPTAPVLPRYRADTLRQSLLVEERWRREAAALGNASDEAAADETAAYRAAIALQVERSWRHPPGIAAGMEVELVIRLAPSGDVLAVSVTRSSGDVIFDASARAAVRRVGSFPLLRELPRPFFEQYFRRLRLLFRPQAASAP